ncbi:hypothetical protein [Nonomuraea ferruginea]|uniref:Lipoprotein n=1 Tax=Nonomuraea ferruginea TaxID=46174 RepID=A0ABT4SS66_9ACTN|nr:hypothetical protein [Nonomuraea ferruginea]MDA0639889.1 hypothetical protein [Nonomuraea ferruginea]
MNRLLALGLALSLAAGCTHAPIPEEPAVASAEDLLLPFDAYKPTPGQRALLDTAHRSLVSRCLKRRGISRRLLPAPPDPRNSRRYGVVDHDQAHRFGYHLPTTDEPAEPGKTDGAGKTRRTDRSETTSSSRKTRTTETTDRSGTVRQVGSGKTRTAETTGRSGKIRRSEATGRSGAARQPETTGRSGAARRDGRSGAARRDGRSGAARRDGRSGEARRGEKARRHLYVLPWCEGRAAERLAPSERAPWDWLAQRDTRTLERSSTRPQVREAIMGWVACMRDAGHPYPSPEAAIGDPRWDLDKRAISADEKRTAVADVVCKWSSGLVARWFAADAALQRALVHKHAGRFALLRADLNERVQRATTLLQRHTAKPVRRHGSAKTAKPKRHRPNSARTR